MRASEVNRALVLVGDARAAQAKLGALAPFAANRQLNLLMQLHGRDHVLGLTVAELRTILQAQLQAVAAELQMLGVILDKPPAPPVVPAETEPAVSGEPGQQAHECPACYIHTAKPCGRAACGILQLQLEGVE